MRKMKAKFEIVDLMISCREGLVKGTPEQLETMIATLREVEVKL